MGQATVTQLETPPPADVDLEAVVLSECLTDPAAWRIARDALSGGEWYSDAHRWIWRAMDAVASDDGPAVELVASWLRESNRLEQVGDTPYLLRLINETPSKGFVGDACARLKRLHEQRELIAQLKVAQAHAVTGDLTAARQSAKEAIKDETDSGIRILSTSDIMAPLPPIDWLVEGLSICHGAPVLIAGKGYAGKTLSVQSMAVALAMGAPIWERFECGQPRRVLHLDWEQGGYLSRLRYQRLMAGLGAEPRELGDRLELAPYPRLQIDDPGAYDKMRRLVEGRDLVIVDSFRAAARCTEENASEARMPLDLMGELSDELGVVFVVLHHARKDQVGGKNSGAETMRGSGALFDGAGGMFVMVGKRGEPTVVEHHKERMRGQLTPTFELERVDVFDEYGGNENVGVRVVARDLAEERRADTSAKFETQCQKVYDVVRDNQGASKNEIKGKSGLSGSNFGYIWAVILERGWIRVENDPEHRQKQRCYTQNEIKDPWSGVADIDQTVK